jgi:hypothetical protein
MERVRDDQMCAYRLLAGAMGRCSYRLSTSQLVICSLLELRVLQQVLARCRKEGDLKLVYSTCMFHAPGTDPQMSLLQPVNCRVNYALDVP